MLIQFAVKNFRAFKDKATLSLVASGYDKNSNLENIIEGSPSNLRILKSAVIFGANASGKTKFMEALMFMKYFVISSSKNTLTGDKIKVEPFRLSTETEDMPSEFEIVFVFKNECYRYGFEVNQDVVVSEWLYHKPHKKEIELFYRDYQEFEIHNRNFSKGNTVVKQELVRENALLISVAAQFNDTISNNVIEWFANLKILSGLSEEGYHGYTMSKTESTAHKSKILDLLKAADLGIQDIKLEKADLNQLPKEVQKTIKEKILIDSNEDFEYLDIVTFHKKYDENKKASSKLVDFSLEDDESSGTNKFYSLTGPILDVLENGYTLVIDELDSKLHTNLVFKIISMFNSNEINKNNAQLIFNSHNTNLLDSELFRRDQVWFTEKDKYGESRLYSLADFKSDDVRKNESFEDNYIRGKYGAVPYLAYFDNLDKTLR